MDIQEIAVQIITLASAHQKRTGNKVMKTADLLHQFPSFAENDLAAAFHYLHEMHQINAKFLKTQKIPIAFILQTTMDPEQIETQATPDTPSDGILSPVTDPLVHLAGAFDHEYLTQLIHTHTSMNSADRRELSKVHHQLRIAEDYNLSLPRGYLHQHSHTFKKFPWLTGQVASFLLKWVNTLPAAT